MTRFLRLAAAAAALLALTACATTSHYYSASDYSGIRIGNARVTSGVTAGVTPAGVSITPTVGYYRTRKTAE